MKFDDLYWTFISWGYALKPGYYQRFKVYFEDMIRRKRVMILEDSNGIVAVITFFITRNHEALANKPEFACPMDDPNGSEIYIDKMICKRWTMGVRRLVQDIVESHFPRVMIGFWHREPDNRCVVTYKKGTKHADKNTG